MKTNPPLFSYFRGRDVSYITVTAYDTGEIREWGYKLASSARRRAVQEYTNLNVLYCEVWNVETETRCYLLGGLMVGKG